MEAKTKDLWVFIETEEDGSPKKVGLELLNPGRRLADKQGGKLVAVVIGDNIAASVEAASVFVSVLVEALVSLLLPQPANVPIAIAPVNASAIVF